MVSTRFDRLTRTWSSRIHRRTVLGGLLAAWLLPLEAAARPHGDGQKRKRNGNDNDKNKNKQRQHKRNGNGNGRAKKRATAQADACWRAGACIPGKGANVSRCDLEGYTAPSSLNCTGCNLSRANLTNATFSGTNFTRANLSGACLVDADFTGATFANNTNLANAIFCRTFMPDGNENNSGCESGTACCPTCSSSAQCSPGQICEAGNCRTCTPATWTNQTTFGSEGTGPGQFESPVGVTISNDMLTAWVVDQLNDRISVWTRPAAGSTAWTNQTTFGSEGAGPSQLNNPLGIAVSNDTLTAWVADPGNNRISIWTRPNSSSTAWTYQTTFGSLGSGPSQFRDPSDVAVSSDTLTVWVADPGNARIGVWTRPNAGSTAWTNQTTFGSFGSDPSQFHTPFRVVVSSDTLTAWVVVAGNDRIAVWTRPAAGSTAWTYQTTFGSEGAGPGQFGDPRDVAISGDTLTAWVADPVGNRISIWTRPNSSSTAWTYQTTFGSEGTGPSQFKSPFSVAVSSDGLTAWVADANNNRISVWAVCPA